MHPLVDSLVQLVTSLGDVAVQLGTTLLPFLPVAVWIVFWMFAVNWVKLRWVLLQGGWIGLALIGVAAVLVWGTVAPPASGTHQFLGLNLGNFVGKTVLVTTLICIALLCGSVQLSGACGSWCRFEEPAPEPAPHGHDSHGHDDSHGHGH